MHSIFSQWLGRLIFSLFVCHHQDAGKLMPGSFSGFPGSVFLIDLLIRVVLHKVSPVLLRPGLMRCLAGRGFWCPYPSIPLCLSVTASFLPPLPRSRPGAPFVGFLVGVGSSVALRFISGI